MKRNNNNQNLAERNPINHRRHSTPPIVIWSNSAYAAAADERQSSVASNDPPSDDGFNIVMSREEMRLREELGREIEEELERELMDGIMALVRRLSDLKAKRFLRELGDPRRVLRSDDDDGSTMMRSKCRRSRDKIHGVGKMNKSAGDDGGRCSDAESRTKDAVKHVRVGQRRGRF